MEKSNIKCARTACPSLNAVCEHTHDGRLYCPRCARMINEYYLQGKPEGTPPLVKWPVSNKELPHTDE